MPKRPLARALYFFYDRKIPLGAIYDPTFYAAVPCDPHGNAAEPQEYGPDVPLMKGARKIIGAEGAGPSDR